MMKRTITALITLHVINIVSSSQERASKRCRIEASNITIEPEKGNDTILDPFHRLSLESKRHRLLRADTMCTVDLSILRQREGSSLIGAFSSIDAIVILLYMYMFI